MLHTASRITSRLATRQTRAFNTAHLRRSSLSNESVCEIITDSKDPRLAEVYRLRHSVGSAFMDLPRTHSHVHEDATGKLGVRDDLDEADSTVHFLCRNPKSGKVVSSIRTVDANKSTLEMELHNWWKLSDDIKQGGAVEWCRLVADPSARGTTAAPMLYIQSVRYHQDKTKEFGGNNNFVFMVDQRATKLLKYYNDWTPTVQLSPDAVRCDEYEIGRKSYVLNMPMGEEGSLARAKFQANVYHPAVLGSCFMKSYRDIKIPEPLIN